MSENDLAEVEEKETIKEKNHIPNDRPYTSQQKYQQINFSQSFHLSSLPIEATQLERLEKIQPGITDRIIKLTEKTVDHTHKMQEKSLIASIILKQLGQIFGFIIVLASLFCSTQLALHGDWIGGAILTGFTLASIVSIFVLGKNYIFNKKK